MEHILLINIIRKNKNLRTKRILFLSMLSIVKYFLMYTYSHLLIYL